MYDFSAGAEIRSNMFFAVLIEIGPEMVLAHRFHRCARGERLLAIIELLART